MQIIRTTRKITTFAIVLLSLLCFAKITFAADALLQSDSMTYLGAFTVQGFSYNGCSSYSSNGYCPEQTNYGSSVIGFNPNGNGEAGSLFIGGRNQSGTYIGEIIIPTPVNSTDPSNLPVAQFLHGMPYFWDISEGHFTNVGLGGTDIAQRCSNGWGVGGILPVGNSILTNSYCYYLAEGGSYVPFFWHNSSDVSTTGVFGGMHGLKITDELSISGEGAGDFQSGALGKIPSAYQTQLGGSVLVGANPTGMSIVSRTTYGPSIIAFDPSDFGTANTVSSTINANTLVTYDQGHQTLYENWNTDANQYYSMTDHYGAVIFPENSRTILVVGRHGHGALGIGCSDYLTLAHGVAGYGNTTANCSELCGFEGAPACQLGSTCGGVSNDMLDGNGNVTGEWPCLYDPFKAGTGHGPSAWPYSSYVWAYDVGDSSGNNTTGNTTANLLGGVKNNLTAAKLGQVKPLDLKPYAVWSLPDSDDVLAYNFHALNNDNGATNYGASGYVSGTYDSATGKAYFLISGGSKQGSNYSYYPVVEVYQINAGTGTGDVTAPNAPSGLSVS